MSHRIRHLAQLPTVTNRPTKGIQVRYHIIQRGKIAGRTEKSHKARGILYNMQYINRKRDLAEKQVFLEQKFKSQSKDTHMQH